MSASDVCNSGWALTWELYAHHSFSPLLIGWGWWCWALPGHAGIQSISGMVKQQSQLSALIRETPESSLAPSAMWRHSEKIAVYEVGPHQTLNLPVPWSWTSQPPELWEINVCCLSYPVCNSLLWQFKWTRTYVFLLYDNILLPSLSVPLAFNGT